MVESKEITDYVGDLAADPNVALSLPLVLERRLCIWTVSNPEIGIRPVLEVSLIEGIQRTPAHPRLPEYRKDDVAEAGVLVLFEVVQYLRSLVFGEDCVRYLVPVVGLRNPNQLVHPVGNGVDMFAELNEAFDAGHIGLEGDGFHVLKPLLFEFLNLVAGQLVQRLDPTLIGEPVAEEIQSRLIVRYRGVRYVGRFVFQVAILRFVRRSCVHCRVLHRTHGARGCRGGSVPNGILGCFASAPRRASVVVRWRPTAEAQRPGVQIPASPCLLSLASSRATKT